LIVDDDAAFRSTARELLAARGFEVAGEAGDGRSAIAETRRLLPDAVLLDVHLPEDDGFDVLADLARQRPGLRVLLTSSDAGAATEELARRSGAVGFVAKTDLATADLEPLLGRA
jgi:DNA-binding NarL/FixJ family response regulator